MAEWDFNMKQYSFLLESLNNNSPVNVLKRKLKTIKYGLRDPKTNKQWKKWNEENSVATEEDYDKVWRLGTSQETLQSKIGICWDTVEVERDFLSKTNIEFKMFFAHGTVYEDPTHTWIIYKDTDNKWKWLERSWGTFENNDYEWDNWMDGVKQITKHLVEFCDKHHKYTVYLLKKYPKPGYDSSKFQHFCIHQKKII